MQDRQTFYNKKSTAFFYDNNLKYLMTIVFIKFAADFINQKINLLFDIYSKNAWQ